MRTSHLCRCSKGNDMTCPQAQPLEKLTARLQRLGYRKEVHVVDALWAKSLMAECTNCGSRGGFDAIGFRNKRKESTRVFWLCRTCSHWTEV
jgi:hypothetical protein